MSHRQHLSTILGRGLVPAVLGMIVIIISAVIATAASLGEASSTDLFAADFTGTPTTPLLPTSTTTTSASGSDVYDGFDGSGPLHVRVADSGQAWTVHAGAFLIDGSAATGAAVGVSRATISSGFANAEVAAPATAATNRNFGLIINAAPDGSSYFHSRQTRQGNGRSELVRVSGGVSTVVATANGTGDTTGLVRLTHFNGVYRLFRGTTQLVTYTATAAEITQFGSNTRHGIYTNADATTLFESFSVVGYAGP